MSEYQYYEFRAIDRPLDERQINRLRQLSTRAEITPTSFTNTYHYGDFRGNPRRLMETYFDAFVYVANWGTRWLMFRLPHHLFGLEAASAYRAGECASCWTKGEHVLLEFRSDEEGGGGWEEGEGWLELLLPLRTDLLNGDQRCLYLGWLVGVQFRELEDDTIEPPVPPGLRNLSTPLQRFVDFLRIDTDLIEVAAKQSTGKAPAGPSSEELTAWVRGLPAAAKDAWLLRLAGDSEPYLQAEFLRHFRDELAKTKPAHAKAGDPQARRRTVGQLLAAQETHAEENRRLEAERAAKEQERQARERAEARARYLDALAEREAVAWQEVETLIETRRPKDYDRAVEILKDLRDLGARAGRQDEVTVRLRHLRDRYSNRSSLKRRFHQAGLNE